MNGGGAEGARPLMLLDLASELSESFQFAGGDRLKTNEGGTVISLERRVECIDPAYERAAAGCIHLGIYTICRCDRIRREGSPDGHCWQRGGLRDSAAKVRGGEIRW